MIVPRIYPSQLTPDASKRHGLLATEDDARDPRARTLEQREALLLRGWHLHTIHAGSACVSSSCGRKHIRRAPRSRPPSDKQKERLRLRSKTYLDTL